MYTDDIIHLSKLVFNFIGVFILLAKLVFNIFFTILFDF